MKMIWCICYFLTIHCSKKNIHSFLRFHGHFTEKKISFLLNEYFTNISFTVQWNINPKNKKIKIKITQTHILRSTPKPKRERT